MFHYASLLTIFAPLILCHLSSVHSSDSAASGLLDEIGDVPRPSPTLFFLLKGILDESNVSEQVLLLNQLREYLNGMCLAGHLGLSNARACQAIVDLVQEQSGERQLANADNGREKRFFCNGFIGCKSAGR